MSLKHFICWLALISSTWTRFEKLHSTKSCVLLEKVEAFARTDSLIEMVSLSILANASPTEVLMCLT